jgi:hypothetical protein
VDSDNPTCLIRGTSGGVFEHTSLPTYRDRIGEYPKKTHNSVIIIIIIIINALQFINHFPEFPQLSNGLIWKQIN